MHLAIGHFTELKRIFHTLNFQVTVLVLRSVSVCEYVYLCTFSMLAAEEMCLNTPSAVSSWSTELPYY